VSTTLDIRNVTLAYGVNRVVRSVSFSIEEGSAFAILGPNGAGKTSILRAVSGLMPVAGGDLIFRGESLVAQRPHAIVMRGLSHVPEGRQIFPEMTVLDNLMVGATVRIRDRKRVAELLERNFALFPILKEKAKQAGGSLSGGQQQQLTVARGLMADPKLLVVDEPTLGLAPAVILTMVEMFRKLLSLGLTIVIAEQNAEFALRVATRGVVISSGQVSFQGDVETLRHGDAMRRAYLGG
jgi:branched-chain amino acid transport system ATP-binding protein